MEFDKLHSYSLKELFINKIEDSILSGELKVGSKLPTERELSEKLDVSRSVINSGLNELARKGFLEIHPREGVFVSNYRRFGNCETLLAIMKYNKCKMSNQEIKSFFEFKILIDSFAVEKAIDNIKEKDIQVLLNYLEGISNSSSAKECALSAYAFNHEIAILSGNTFAPLIYNSFKEPVVLLWEKYINLYGKNTIYDYSENLFKLMMNKETDKAVMYVKEHLQESVDGSKVIYD